MALGRGFVRLLSGVAILVVLLVGALPLLASRKLGVGTSVPRTDDKPDDACHQRTPLPVSAPGVYRILFQAQGPRSTEIYTVRDDGADLRQLTDNDEYDHWPVWSPDGSRIAFGRAKSFFDASLNVMNADGSGHVGYQQIGGSYAWSPDATEIALQGFGASSASEIFVVDLQTGASRQLTDNDVTDTNPRWSPISSEIAVVRDSRQLNILHPVSGERQILESAFYDGQSWSPDGTRLAFIKWTLETAPDLYTVNSDGSGLCLVGTNGVHLSPHISSFGLTWSPDGTKLAFPATDGGGLGQGIYVANVDGSRLERVASGYRPAWSPDGRRISYYSDAIYTVDLETGSIRQITQPLLAEYISYPRKAIPEVF